jgi:predicted RND superfamily exporter protein
VASSLVPLAVVGYASAIVVGLLAAIGVPVNMATATVPTIILVVGLADSVHFLAELRRQYARTGDRRASLLATVEAIALPCLLTTATSAVGFLALVSSRVGPLREFGYSTAIGLVVAYLTSMWLTPVVLELIGRPSKRYRSFPAAPVLGEKVSRFAAAARERLGATVAVTGLLFGGSVAAVTGLTIDSDFVGYLSEDHSLRKDIAIIEETLGGADVIEVILDAEKPGLFRTPEGLALLDTLSKDVLQLNGVSRVFSLADYLRLANAVMNDRRADEDAPLPETAEAIAQLELLDPGAFAALADSDQSQARISMQIRTLSSEDVLRLAELAQQTANIDLDGTGVRATFTGLPPLFAQIVTNLVEDAAGSFGIAAALIFFAMLIGLRDPLIAAATMIPNVLTVGMTFGTMALLGLSFDTNSAFVACLGIGIAVDDTIHVAARYQRAREEGAPSKQAAVNYAITHAGHPVVLTSILLAIGFSVLCLSSFAPTFRVGLLSAILVAYAVLLDLFLLPVLMITADRRS